MKRRRTFRLLLDTHIWVHYVAGSKDLPVSLREAVDEALGSCWLSPISLWELGVLVSKEKVRLNREYQGWLHEALEAFPVQEAAINFEVARRCKDLDLPHNDPADRLLAATALVYELTLVTLDENLVNAPWLPTLTA